MSVCTLKSTRCVKNMIKIMKRYHSPSAMKPVDEIEHMAAAFTEFAVRKSHPHILLIFERRVC